MSPCPDSANQLSICILGQWISRDSLWALCACYIFLQDSWKFSTLCLELEGLNYEYTANTAVRAKLNASHCLFSYTVLLAFYDPLPTFKLPTSQP